MVVEFAKDEFMLNDGSSHVKASDVYMRSCGCLTMARSRKIGVCSQCLYAVHPITDAQIVTLLFRAMALVSFTLY